MDKLQGPAPGAECTNRTSNSPVEDYLPEQAKKITHLSGHTTQYIRTIREFNLIGIVYSIAGLVSPVPR